MATLLWGFVQAPFFHIHAEDLDHDHGAGLTHIHGRAIHNDSFAEIESHTADDDEIDVPWSIAAPPGIHFDIALDIAGPVASEPLMVQAGTVPAIDLHSHDPPASYAQHSRPPPA